MFKDGFCKMNCSKRLKSCLTGSVSFVILILIDQLTKWLAVVNLKDKEPFIIIDGVFQLRYLENRGAAFGMLQNRQFIFVAGAAVVFLIVAFFYVKMPQGEQIPAFTDLFCPAVFRCDRKYDRQTETELCGRFLLLQSDRLSDL